MLQVINGNTQAHLCNQPNESCEVKSRREGKKEKGNITFSSANAVEIISGERRRVRVKFEMRELLAGSMRPGFRGLGRAGPGRAGPCFQLHPGSAEGSLVAGWQQLFRRVDISDACEDITFHLLWPASCFKIVQSSESRSKKHATPLRPPRPHSCDSDPSSSRRLMYI